MNHIESRPSIGLGIDPNGWNIFQQIIQLFISMETVADLQNCN